MSSGVKHIKKKKKGQLDLSFGMIFSIFLIVVFIAVAFYGINKFLEWQRLAQIKIFQNDLQQDVDNMWSGAQGSQEVSYNLPGRVEKVCFIKEGQLEFEPLSSGEGVTPFEIQHLDYAKMTQSKNSLCIPTSSGKIEFIIKKSSGESLVTISVK
jgi:hypothetical protein